MCGQIFLAAIFGGLLSLGSARPLKLRPHALAPIWKLDVRALGYVPPAYHGLPDYLESLPDIGPLNFVTRNRLVVTFVDRVAPASLPHREEPRVYLPLRLRALFIDASAGRLEARRQWPTTSDRSRITPTLEGNFIVVMPDRLQLYSAGFKLLKELDLPVIQSASEGSSNPSTSPGLRFLLLFYVLRGDTTVWRGFVDTQNLRIVSSWSQIGQRMADPYEIADDGTAVVTDGQGEIETRTPEGTRHVLCLRMHRGCVIGTFVSDQALFSGFVELGMGRVAMRLTLIDGEIAFQEELPEKQYVRQLARSAGTRRFAVAIDRGKGGSEFFDIAPHYSLYRIIVYDLPSRQWVYALGAAKEGIKAISALALSPDGTLMALINQDGILELFRLPPADKPSGATPEQTHDVP